jgi:hypothetical protein
MSTSALAAFSLLDEEHHSLNKAVPVVGGDGRTTMGVPPGINNTL